MLAFVILGALLAISYPWNLPPRPTSEPSNTVIDESLTPPITGNGEPLRIHPHFEVLEVLPHDPKAFTQGLTYDGKTNTLWEGTGNYGESELRHVDPATGKVLASKSLHPKMFGEGISFFETREGERRLIQFTWKEKKGWIYHADTLDIVSEFTYETSNGDGWGITYNPNQHEFLVTDGSPFIHFWDADTLQETKRIEVKYAQPSGAIVAVPHLNEVEYLHDGTILSNVWYQDIIIKINIETGMVEHVYDFRPLYVDRSRGVDCFNGIAVTDKPNELWVTGKLWPHMYRIRLLH